jgi:phage repressor protein C with HTH and peptisase S24 domain
VIGHWAGAAELVEQGLHGIDKCDSIAHIATHKSHRLCASFSRQAGMPDLGPVTLRLKRLREMTDPKLSVRALADKLGMPSSTYAAYEDPNKYKKALLPQQMAHDLADVLTQHGVPRDAALALGGLDSSGALERSPESLADQLDAVLLPEIEVGYSMGGGADVDDFPVIQHVPFSRAWLASLTNSPASQLFVARGDGDSMMPTLLDQDIVIIDRSQNQMRQQDRIWALVYGGFGMIKRLRGLPDGSLQINSDNPAVSPIQASEGEAFLIGRVVAVVRRI